MPDDLPSARPRTRLGPRLRACTNSCDTAVVCPWHGQSNQGRVVATVTGTGKYLQMLQDLAFTFGLHLRGQAKPRHDMEEAISKVASAV